MAEKSEGYKTLPSTPYPWEFPVGSDESRAAARAIVDNSGGPPGIVVRFVKAPGALADAPDFDWETWKNRKPTSVWSDADIQRRLDELPMGPIGGPPTLHVFFETVELNADGSPLSDEDSKNAQPQA